MRKLRAVSLILWTVTFSTASAQSRVQSSEDSPAVPQAARQNIGVSLTPVPRQRLIQSTAVQEELSLTATQKAQIAALLEESQKRGTALRREMLQNRDQNEAPDVQKVQSDGQAYFEARRAQERLTDEAIVKVFDRKQRSRFEQVHLQVEGPVAFSRPEIAQRLNLSDEQFEAIGMILKEGRSQLGASVMEKFPRARIQEGGSSESGPKREQSRVTTKTPDNAVSQIRGGLDTQARKLVMREIGKLLSKGQKARYEKMLGQPFDLSRLQGQGTVSPTAEKKPPE